MAAYVVIAQAIVAFLTGIWLIVSDFTEGTDDITSSAPAAGYVGTGTAIFIFIVFGAAAAAAVGLLKGKSWGRGAIVLLEALLLFVAFYMFSGGAYLAGALVAVTSIATLVGLFHPRSWQWFADKY